MKKENLTLIVQDVKLFRSMFSDFKYFFQNKIKISKRTKNLL